MKKYIFILFCTFSFSQVETNKTEPFTFNEKFRLGLNKNLNFGNNYFNKETKHVFGMFSELTLFNLYNVDITFGGGLDFSQAEVNSFGNFSSINTIYIYPQLSYPIKFNKLTLNPSVAFQFVNLNYSNNNISAKQNGGALKIGSFIEYNLLKSFDGFVGLHYINFQNNLNSNSVDQKYFGQGHSVNISLGILFK